MALPWRSGLEQGAIPGAVVTFAVLISLVEAQGLRIKKSDGADWLPGDYGTLRIAEKGTEQFFSLQEVRRMTLCL